MLQIGKPNFVSESWALILSSLLFAWDAIISGHVGWEIDRSCSYKTSRVYGYDMQCV